MIDPQIILNVWPKQIIFWKTFSTRMKIQQLLLKFMLQGSSGRTIYSRIVAKFTMIHIKSKIIIGIHSDAPAYLHTSVRIVHMDTALNSDFNF